MMTWKAIQSDRVQQLILQAFFRDFVEKAAFSWELMG